MASKSKKLSFAADIFEQDIEGIIRKIPIGEIQPSAEQPRTQFDESIHSLADSIKAEGLLQPIVVTKEGAKYKIIAGERRYRAAQMAGLDSIECRILRKNPKDTYRLAVIENLQRENLNAIDEAKAFRKLKQEYGYNDGDLAKIVGKSRNYVNEILSVADIPAPWVNRAKTAGIESKNFFIQFAQAIKAGTAEAFLTAYESGAVKTVAAAKQFNKTQKSPGPKAPPKSGGVSDIQCRGDIKDKRWSLNLNFTTAQPGTPDKLRQVEKAVAEFIRKQF